MTPRAGAAPFDSARYRQVLGHFPTGVAVVTGRAPAADPVGLAVGSFTSVSLEPPLVAFCPAASSSSWPEIESSGHFCANVLAEDQEQLSRTFATSGADKFRGVGWSPAPGSGAPILDGVLAWVDCEIDAVHEGGDHYIVVGRVLALDAPGKGGPLVFYRGGYGRFVP